MPLALRHEYKVALTALGAILVLYGALAYVFLPFAWKHYEHQKALAGFSMVTRTNAGIPGDPINVGLVGSKEDVLCAMDAAGWYPADPVTLGSSLKIVGSVVLDRPYRDAPISRLNYEGRRQDLAFEKPAGKSADTRHHVRFWRVIDSGQEGRPVWLGAVTFDRGIGFSHRDAKITHHIAPDIDAERDLLSEDLNNAKVVESDYEVSGIGPTINGRNGEGDSYFTDGEIKFSVLIDSCSQRTTTTTELGNPPLVEAKNRVWSAIAKAVRWLMGERPADNDQ
jgi:hypothetical protein